MQTAVRIDERAAESLEFIRTTLARSATFTAVPGYGGVAMGVVGLTAAILGARQHDDRSWLAVWIVAALVAAPMAFLAMWRKARRHGLSLWSANGRRFAQGFLPSIIAGGVLTWSLVSVARVDLVPSTWLLLYGAGVLGGSSASIPILAWLGAAFMMLGVGAEVTGPAWRDAWLGAGFGGLQIIFGMTIARKHGG
jgi:hypothetical protein